MKKLRKNNYFLYGLTAFLVIAASICFFLVVFHGGRIKAALSGIGDLLLPIMFGFVLAYLMTPVLNRIEQYILIPLADRLKIKESDKRRTAIRAIGIILTFCFFVLIIYSLVSMMLSQIVPSILNIISNFDIYYNNIVNWVNQVLEDNPALEDYILRLLETNSAELETWLNNTVLSKATDVLKTLSLSVINIFGALWDYFMGIIIAVYLMASKEKFAGQAKKVVYAVFKLDTANTVIRNFRFTHRTFIGFIGGKILDSLIIGILCFVGTSLLKTPYPALISLVVGVTNVIPVFGPYIGAIPTIILTLVVDPGHPLTCVYYALFNLALQQFDGNVLGPKILGDSTGLSGFWVIFSITLFGGLWGVPGMIIGVPTFAVIYAAVRSLIYTSLERKNLPKDTEEYIDVGYVDEQGFHPYIPEYQQKAAERLKKGRDGDDTRKDDGQAPES